MIAYMHAASEELDRQRTTDIMSGRVVFPNVTAKPEIGV